ncbi:histidine phosphatase family protein [Bacillus spongiae]|uniref:Histidine phosphatase family protein n=1 Tax=Bacillus spongiae TaxID=2683610 RepID=A0ABU8HHN1_9BACI
MTTIFLVRHGETNWNAIGKLQGRTDIPLNSVGVQQAEECSMYLKAFEWDVMITSPLKRARTTAEIINKKLMVPLIERDEFLERCYGDAEGMTIEERTATFPDKIYRNQEEWTSLNQRVMTGIQELHQRYKGQKILLVAHGAVINAILATISNGEIGTGKTKLMNACISNIHYHEEQWRVYDYNQVAHLSNYCGV